MYNVGIVIILFIIIHYYTEVAPKDDPTEIFHLNLLLSQALQ